MESDECLYSGRGVRGTPKGPDRRSFRDRSGRGSPSVGAVAHAKTKESRVHGLSREEGGAEDRGGDVRASTVARGHTAVRSRAAGTASIRCILLRRGLSSRQRRRGTVGRPSSSDGGAARGRRACLLIHDVRVARTCGGSHNQARSVSLRSAGCAERTQTETHGASTTVACGLRLTGLSAR